MKSLKTVCVRGGWGGQGVMWELLLDGWEEEKELAVNLFVCFSHTFSVCVCVWTIVCSFGTACCLPPPRAAWAAQQMVHCLITFHKSSIN